MEINEKKYPIRNKSWLYLILLFVIIISVFWLGLYLGMSVKPRSAISLNKCENNCWKKNEFLGLIGSIGIKLNLEKVVVQKENDSCFSIKMPNSQLKFHYVIIPKKDIEDIEDFNSNNTQIFNDCLSIATEHIKQENLIDYQFLTNGPGYQQVRYLHFHLKSKSDNSEL